MTDSSPVDVLVVGAGPTGLTLALQLAAFGVRARIIDRGSDRVHESRALAIQPRTLEVLAGCGVTDDLVAAGNPAVQLCLHTRRGERRVPLFDLGLPDTAYPYLLFLSQAETERILDDHLARTGVAVERHVELVDLGEDGDHVLATLRRGDRPEEVVPARYVVGCDGAHSAVRTLSGIGFVGGDYPQTFVLADAEADGIAPGAAHVFLSDPGMLFFFPLASPATWRLLAMRPPGDATAVDAPVTLGQVQALADTYTGGAVQVRDPVWMTTFRLHHRAAARYRAGRIFLAGDAAHIHSPAGAQGMNTGIQDSVNLAWKLAHTLRDHADRALLDSYEPERAPVGTMVVRFTDRAFSIATSTNPLIRLARTRAAPRLLPIALKAKRPRGYAYRILSELAVHYRRSPLSDNGPHPSRHGPRAGDRFPDAHIVHNGLAASLHRVIADPAWHLLLCGPSAEWPTQTLNQLARAHRGTVVVHHLAAGNKEGGLEDPHGEALRRLGLSSSDSAAYLVRPDGYIGYRAGGTDTTGLERYLHRHVPGAVNDAMPGF
jgi:2-polyprenyl-6-methoxyphenol hydroxylase-like FAD-dependent oxidoreductase